MLGLWLLNLGGSHVSAATLPGDVFRFTQLNTIIPRREEKHPQLRCQRLKFARGTDAKRCLFISVLPCFCFSPPLAAMLSHAECAMRTRGEAAERQLGAVGAGGGEQGIGDVQEVSDPDR